MSTKDLAERLEKAAAYLSTDYGYEQAAACTEASALLARLAEVDGEMETTEVQREGWHTRWNTPDSRDAYTLLRDLDRLRLKVAEQARELEAANTARSAAEDEMEELERDKVYWKDLAYKTADVRVRDAEARLAAAGT